ncbi:hypothetical protein AC1031_007445 [Aphanomyces cochlioides]|nr:hypothetical protein AC1031_007445 [Aphanomyces cochlioides]
MVSIQSILLGAFAFAQTVSAGNCNFREGDVIALKADTGKYVTRCRNCIGCAAYPDSVNFQGPINSGTPYSYWTIVDAGNGKIALKGDLGNYLSRCNNCAAGAAYPDEAFVHVSDWRSGPWAQWTCEDADNGKIALKADSGKYLARCNNCVRSGPADVAFVHAPAWKGSPWAQFEVEYLKRASNCYFKDGDVIALQADTGKYVTRCRNCIAHAAYPDSVNLQSPINAGTPYSYWTVYNTGGGKIALKGDLGNYFARCNNCVPGARTPDEAFVHVSDWKSGPWAQFTCEDASNGKIALKADTGKYVTRCNGCVPGGPADVITMHVNNWRDGDAAQFTVVKKPVVLEMSINQVTAEPNRVVLVLGSMFAGSCLALLGMYVFNRRRVPATADERKGLNPL